MTDSGKCIKFMLNDIFWKMYKNFCWPDCSKILIIGIVNVSYLEVKNVISLSVKNNVTVNISIYSSKLQVHTSTWTLRLLKGLIHTCYWFLDVIVKHSISNYTLSFILGVALVIDQLSIYAKYFIVVLAPQSRYCFLIQLWGLRSLSIYMYICLFRVILFYVFSRDYFFIYRPTLFPLS